MEKKSPKNRKKRKRWALRQIKGFIKRGRKTITVCFIFFQTMSLF